MIERADAEAEIELAILVAGRELGQERLAFASVAEIAPRIEAQSGAIQAGEADGGEEVRIGSERAHGDRGAGGDRFDAVRRVLARLLREIGR